MNDDLRARADHSLTTAAEALDLADPRPAYRERLRRLKDANPEGFDRALRHYEDVVLPEVANGDGSIEAWVQYGAFLASLSAPGRLMQIDPNGTAMRYSAPVARGALILHVPDDNSAPVLTAVAPIAPTPAQQATIDLLVNGSLGVRTTT
jgi:hypothetical protein